MIRDSNLLKGLFKVHETPDVDSGEDDYLSQILDDPTIFKVVYFGSIYDMDSKECIESKNGTCATIECPHNYRRYGDDIYEHYKKITKEQDTKDE